MPHNPSTIALFSLLSPKSVLLYAIPAILASLLSGAIAPYMTIVVGRSFDAFASFPLSQPTHDDKSRLLHAVGIAAIELLSLAAAALALSSITSALWVATGEHNTRALRLRVYDAITAKDLAWFDEKAAAEPSPDSATDDNAPLGPGGLMSSFSQYVSNSLPWSLSLTPNRQTEQVRLASSLASGLLLQYVTTCLTCLVLAFLRSWSLTLVVLSAIPALILIQGLSQAVATPLLARERSQLASAASLLDRAVRAIATVKAHNAAPFEQRVFASSLDRLRATVFRLSALWGTSAGLAQFATMAMFVQGFWFGARLVRNHTLSPGDVMAVFWACLIATSSLQTCIPQLIVLAKGKSAIASLLNLIDSPSSTTATTTIVRKIVPIRKIAPKKCLGELALHNITFAYPARPDTPALTDVSLFLPARETTFIVGGSGSGKSSVARLLLALYAPQRGLVHLDNQDAAFLDPAWVRAHVACVSDRECVLVEGSVHENVAMGVAGAGRDPATVTREEVVDACRAALMHEFVRDLPQGYDTLIGHHGACLSGGQKQRLAIARAKLRNPTVLILGVYMSPCY
jgi:ATP-binding cassette, subfamily B (MDR/TAP), member 1